MHYAVGVITRNCPTYDELCEILAPYDENIKVEPYISKTKAELIEETKKGIQNQVEYFSKSAAENDEPAAQYNLRKKRFFEETAPYIQAIKDGDEGKLYAYAIRYYDDDELDEEGNVLSTYNPQSKWDWFVTGGRFADCFEGLETEGECDSLPIRNFPKPKILSDDEIKEQYPEIYETYQKIQDGTYNGFYKVEYLQRLYQTLQDFFASNNDLSFYSVVTPDGEWHEPGQMGWFSSMAEPEDEAAYRRSFYDKFIASMNGEGYITVVDCHI